MLCSKCGAENPAEARFCGKCGTPVTGGPPVIPISVGGDKGSLPPSSKKKSVPLPLIVFGAVVIVILGIAGVAALVHFSSTHPTDPSENDDSSSTLAPLPAPGVPPSPSKFSDYNNTMNPAANTAQANDVSDAAYTQKIIGAWNGHGTLPTGAVIETLAIYSPGGQANWTGSITYLGQQTYFAIRASWEVRNGVFYSRVVASNIPQVMPVGFTSESRIINLTDSEWTYVSAFSQMTETVYRVRGDRKY